MSTPLTTTLSIAAVILKKDRTASFIPVTAQGGSLPYVFSISPNLPTGLAINVSTGEISGSGKIESILKAHTVTVTDSEDNSSAQSFTLVVESAPNKSDLEGRIAAADYNYLRTEIRAILDDLGRNNPAARSSAGYGQIMQSTEVTAGNTITRQQWENLRFDLINVGLHQQGVSPTVSEVINPIRYSVSTPNYRYQDLANLFFNTRFSIGSGRSIPTQTVEITRTGSWTTECSTVVSIIFPGYVRVADSTVIEPIDHARYFFNAGGRIGLISSRQGGTISPQNNGWSSFLSSVGNKQFRGNISDALGFYKLTDTYQIFFQGNVETNILAYLGNEYTIEVKSNVPTNTAGGATQLDFRIIWRDSYTNVISPSDDFVDGTLSLIVQESKPFGSMIPSGNFEVPGPDYSFIPIVFE